MKNSMTLFQYLFTLSMYFLGGCLLAASLAVPIFLAFKVWAAVDPQTVTAKVFVLAGSAGFGYFLFGLTLAALTVFLRFTLCLKLEEGEFAYFSLQGVKWAFVNSLILIVNLAFMDFMRLTPFLPLYYRLMGAKIGHRVQINTKGLADVSLLEIGDDSVIGGDAVLIGHLAEHGKLRLQKTVIGKKVTVGLGSVIMPGAFIGDKALIAARSVLSKNTVVEPGAVFAGTPARFIKFAGEKNGTA